MTAPETERELTNGPEMERPRASDEGSEDRLRIYLHTTRALNPGLPHTVDFPDLWS